MSVDQFERKLREKFDAASIPPGPELWTNIESRLPRNDKRRGIIWLWTAGVSIAACLLGWLWLSPAILPPAGTPETTISEAHKDASAAVVPDGERQTESFAVNPQSESSATLNPAPLTMPKQQNLRQQRWQASHHAPPSAPVLPQQVPLAQTAELTAKEPQALAMVLNISPPSSAGVPATAALYNENVLLSMSRKGLWLTPTRMLEDWPEDLTEAKPSSRWAMAFQMGQDYVSESPMNAAAEVVGLAPLNDAASNGDALTQADFVQYASDPTRASASTSSDQATLVSYPSGESRFRLQAEYRLLPHWSVRSGLGLGVSSQGVISQASLEYSSPLSSPADAASWSYQEGPYFRNTQLEIPMAVAYHFRARRGHWSLATGVSFNRNLNYLQQARYKSSSNDFGSNLSADNSRTVYYVSNQSYNLSSLDEENSSLSSQSLAYRNWNSFLMVQALYERSLSPRFSLVAGPSFKYMMSDIFVGNLASSQAPLRIGLTAGLRFGR